MTDSPVTPNTQTTGALTPGTTFAGKFEIIELLGEGGMSAVYKARHISMDRLVALKVLHPWVLGEGNAAQRFLREARAVSGLNHPNIVKIINFDVEAQQPYMAMELLQGGSLAEYIKKKGRIPAEEAAEICLQSAQALAHAHAAGILHRDIKPGNIMLVPAATESQLMPRVQLVDFGVAKLLDTSNVEQQKLTQTNSVIGTPFYMSPEQCEKQPLDGRSDMYALGCVLYEMLSGEAPFQGDSPLSVMFNHIHDEPPALPKSVPTWLNALVVRMMAKKAEDRLASMDEVVAVLKQSSAPLTIPHRKANLHFAINKPIVAVGLIALTAGCLYLLKGQISNQQVTEERNQKAADLHRKFEDRRQHGASFAEQADLLWDEAQLRGYPEGSDAAHDSMDKLKIEFYKSHLDEPFCEKTAARTEAYMKQFHDDKDVWRKLLLQALHSAYNNCVEQTKRPTITAAEKKFWLDTARPVARRWMEKAAELNDNVAYVEALAGRIESGELQGDAMKVMLLASMQKLTLARADSQQNQNELNGGLSRCGQEMKKIDPEKALKIHSNAVAGFQAQYGVESPVALSEQYTHAEWLYEAGKKEEAKKLWNELLPKFLKSQDPGMTKRAIWTAQALRQHFVWDLHAGQDEAIRYTRIICDKFEQLRVTDKSEDTANAAADEYSRLAQICWLLNQRKEAMTALNRAWQLLPDSNHAMRVHIDSQRAAFNGGLEEWAKQTEALDDGLATIDKYHIENAGALSVIHQQAVVLASNHNAPAGVKLIETRWRPMYLKAMAKKDPYATQAGLAQEDAMVKVWKSW